MIKGMLSWPHAVVCVERGDLVALGQRRIVEGVLDEIVDGDAKVEHRLADVNELGRAFADDMRTEKLAVREREQELHHARLQPHDVSARDFAKSRDTDLVA